MEYGSNIVNLALWDTPGDDDCDHLRPVRYPQAAVILPSFSIDNPKSLDRVICKVRHIFEIFTIDP
jgi:GTPase SAR1 family protein